MEGARLVAAVNPGSASTKIGLFEAAEDGTVAERLVELVEHPEEALLGAARIWDQLPMRAAALGEALARAGVEAGELAAAVGRGGLLPPLPGGTYGVSEAMIEDLRRAERGEHASNLGAPLARDLAAAARAPAFVVDPVSVDELAPVARISGLPEIPRTSLTHALNMRAAARRLARERGIAWDALRLVVAHLGSGVSLAAFRGGRMVDVVNPREEGPFSPERSGSLPLLPFLERCLEEGATWSEVERRLFREGGLLAHLGTRDLREARRRAQEGDEEAGLVLQALAYQVAKWIGYLGAALEGGVDGVILTGGLAHDEALTGDIGRRVAFLGPLSVFAGEDELRSLAEGAARVLAGVERARRYPPEE
jgi:butyrate kinase